MDDPPHPSSSRISPNVHPQKPSGHFDFGRSAHSLLASLNLSMSRPQSLLYSKVDSFEKSFPSISGWRIRDAFQSLRRCFAYREGNADFHQGGVCTTLLAYRAKRWSACSLLPLSFPQARSRESHPEPKMLMLLDCLNPS